MTGQPVADRPAGRASAAGASLAAKFDFLSNLPGIEQVIETHMAFVFLTARRAFKLKKPVRCGQVDHRGLTARRRACTAELRLNRALAGGVYLRIAPLILRRGGGLALGGGSLPMAEGRVVDWLVVMRQLPANRMLDRLATCRRGPGAADVAALCDRLAGFYRRAACCGVPPGGYLDALQAEARVNAAHLAEMAHLLPGIDLPRLCAAMEAAVAAAAPEIAAREAQGWIVEGHGDLRPEHVCLTDPPVIFDRVEFSRRMRLIDVFDELGYLGMECALLGRPEIGPQICTQMALRGFCPPSTRLADTYRLFRCLTRARLSLDHLRDPVPRTPAKWPLRARAYLAEAARLLPALWPDAVPPPPLMSPPPLTPAPRVVPMP